MTVIAAIGENESTTTSTSWLWSLLCLAMRFLRQGSTQEEIGSSIDTIKNMIVDIIDTTSEAIATNQISRASGSVAPSEPTDPRAL